MKRVLLILIFLSTYYLTYAQTKKPYSFDLSANYGNLLVMQRSIDGAASTSINRKIGIDAGVYYAISEAYSFKTGISWVSGELERQSASVDGSQQPITFHNFNMLNIPIAIQRTYPSGFFLESGLLLGIDLNNEEKMTPQNGVGATVGIGYRVRLSPVVGITINSYISAPTLIQFSNEDYPQRLLDSGIRLGIVLF